MRDVMQDSSEHKINHGPKGILITEKHIRVKMNKRVITESSIYMYTSQVHSQFIETELRYDYNYGINALLNSLVATRNTALICIPVRCS